MPELQAASVRDQHERSPRKCKDPRRIASPKDRLDQFLAEIEKQLAHQVSTAAEQFKATAEKVAAASQASFINQITNVTAKLNGRQDYVDSDFISLKQRVSASEDKAKNLNAAMDKLKTSLAHAEAQVPLRDVSNIGTWDRAPHIGTFWFGANVDITQAALKSATAEWFSAANIDMSMVRYNYSAPAKRVSITVIGADKVAVPRAQALHYHLRIGREWRKFSLNGVPLFVSADKSPRLVRQEIQLKKLAKIINNANQNLSLRIHRADGHLSIDNMPIARIMVGARPEIPTKVQWSDAAEAAGIPTGLQSHCSEALAATFADAATSVSWV